MEEVSDPSHDEQLAPWVELGSATKSGASNVPATHAVRALEAISQERSARPLRTTSIGEQAILRRLVCKHGEDVQAMAKDRKLNPDQRTAGELSRAVRKAGGFAKLKEM